MIFIKQKFKNMLRHGTKLAEFSHGDHFRDMPVLNKPIRKDYNYLQFE